ncbi:MAG: hypothetical protein D6806_16965 [Deltaproteobacteria bacterium]|nr:MAG: hypothetical protein D6806_16965 [Deltaproteobacteria bacterium]
MAGTRYLEVQRQTGGLAWSICEPDYGPIVKELGIEAAGMRRKFVLSATPLVETLRVMVSESGAAQCGNSQDCQQGQICSASGRCSIELDSGAGQWQYQAGDNAIFFQGEYLPPPGATVEVLYERGSA